MKSDDTDLSDFFKVLPLTREWIEMAFQRIIYSAGLFSLLRGSGLKWNIRYTVPFLGRFSLLRGSGLKYPAVDKTSESTDVLPLTREWIEMIVQL